MHSTAAFLFVAWLAVPVAGILPKLHGNWKRLRHGAKEPPKTLPCQRPVERAPVEFPAELLTTSKDQQYLEMHSGYVNVTATDYLFYWFVKAGPDAPQHAPVVVWSNGGPGCSAMEGATTELGPLKMFLAKVAGLAGFSNKFSGNPYPWNQKAHLLFVDQPRYVGYSTGTGPPVCSSRDAGLDMVTFLDGWRALFPEIHNPDFILASESYGGHYVPAWTQAIMDHNDCYDKKKIPLVGIAIGNGITNATIQNDEMFVKWAKTQGLIPQDSNAEREVVARVQMVMNLGYVPNYYDYRLIDQGDCCGCYSYNYSTWSLWLTKDAVTKALNVCGNAGDKAFAGCAGGCIDFTSFGCPDDFDANDAFDYSAPLERALTHGIPVTLFYGKEDTACNYVGGYEMASKLSWPGAQKWAQQGLKKLVIGGSASGQIQEAAGLTFIQIDGAGHMTPIDNSAYAYHALAILLVTQGAGRHGRPSSSFLSRRQRLQADGEDADANVFLQASQELPDESRDTPDPYENVEL